MCGSRAATSGSAIAFGQGGQLDRLQGPSRFDVAFRLKENRWNGTVAPQLVVRRVFDAPGAYDELRAWLAEQWRAGEAAWTPDARRIFAELDLAAGTRVSCSSRRASARCSRAATSSFRRLRDG